MFVHAPIGSFGVDFSSMEADKVSENVSKVSQRLLEHGVTAYCPTIVTSSPDYYKRTLPKIKPTPGGKHGAAVLGKSMLCVCVFGIPHSEESMLPVFAGMAVYLRYTINHVHVIILANSAMKHEIADLKLCTRT